MSTYNTIKDSLVEYAVLSVLAIIGGLGFVLWQAVPSTFWERISDAVEKKVLWALLGLLFLIVVGESIYILQSYLRARTTLRLFGGVMWNNNGDLFCPKDEAPVFQSGKSTNEIGSGKTEEVEVFQCPKCDSNYILKDLEGNQITVAKAKQNFFIQQNKKIKGSIQVPEIEEGFDETTLTVLKAFGSTSSRTLRVEHFTGLLNNGTKPVRISHSLDILNKKGYLRRCTTQYVGQNILYELTEQGRKYIVDNDLV